MRARAARAAGLATTTAVLLGVAAAGPAQAHQSPPNCDSNSLQLTLTKDRTVVRNGETSVYTVAASNNTGNACDQTGVAVTLTLPSPEGTPTGQTVTLATNANFPAGTANVVVGTVPYVVNLNPGVSDAVAEAKTNGTLHDAPTDHAAQISKTVGTSITQPAATLTQTITPATGQSPFRTTFTYVVTNTSTTPAPLKDVSVTSEVCTPATYVSGDTNGNGLLDNGEAWTFTCTRDVTTPGSLTSTATVTATNTVDNRPVPVAPATGTVTATAPPKPAVKKYPLVPVNSRSARPDARCVSVPARLRVRARERTTVRVRVGTDDQPARNAVVRITGPGFVKRVRTNKQGIATVRVTPSRRGTLVIQSNRCLGADRVTVLGARRASGRRVPRTTG